MSFLSEIIKTSGNKYASIVENGLEGSDVVGTIDTGSFAFNALLSGSLYGGIPNNKITAIAGEQATGKTFFALGMCKKFLDDNKCLSGQPPNFTSLSGGKFFITKDKYDQLECPSSFLY